MRIRNLIVAGALAVPCIALAAADDGSGTGSGGSQHGTMGSGSQGTGSQGSTGQQGTLGGSQQGTTGQGSMGQGSTGQQGTGQQGTGQQGTGQQGTGQQGTGQGTMGQGSMAGQQGADSARPFEKQKNWELQGTAQQVSSDTITLQRTGNLPPVQFTVPNDAKIKVDGRNASLQQIQPGDEVRATFNLASDTPVAVSLDAKGAKGSKSGSMRQGGGSQGGTQTQ